MVTFYSKEYIPHTITSFINQNGQPYLGKLTKYNKHSIQVVEMKDSQAHKIKEMEARIRELEQAVGQKKMNIDYLEKMIDLAKEHYDIDIKKNSNTLHYGGSKNIKKD